MAIDYAKDDDEPDCEQKFEAQLGVALRGKIESYGNAGMVDDGSGESVKVMIVQITCVIPQSDAKKIMDIEDDENTVSLFIQYKQSSML